MQDIGHGIYYSQTECIHFTVQLLFNVSSSKNNEFEGCKQPHPLL